MTTALRTRPSKRLGTRPKRRTDVYVFKQRVRAWAERIGVQAKEIHVRTMRRKWASCSTTGRVTFSADLLRAEHEWQEYVIVHELLHLQIPNHGKLFKAMLSAHLPDWQRIASRPPRTMPSLALSREREGERSQAG
jgi:hypothetical protein